MKNLEGLLSTEVIKYNKYMKWSPFPDFLKGEYIIQSLIKICFHYCRIYVEEQPKICEDLF